MNDIMKFLIFTMEIHEDFEDNKLPTLDTKVHVEDGKIIHFKFYQKPMATNMVNDHWSFNQGQPSVSQWKLPPLW